MSTNLDRENIAKTNQYKTEYKTKFYYEPNA